MKRIAITGSTGMIGETLVSFFKVQGHEVLRVVRGESDYKDPSQVIRWDIASGMIESDKLEGVDVVIHLAGASIAGQRWTEDYKRIIRDSRVKSTQILANAIAGLENPPKVFICASAMGFYGVRTDAHSIDETHSAGDDYLASVCRQWEHAAKPVEEKGVRTVYLRIGVVLGKQGGALAQMLPIFQKGLGGPIASGAQMMSWVHVDEFPSIMEFVIEHEDMVGPVNVAAPEAVSNKDFTKRLGLVIKKPAFLPVPGVALRLLYGDMADALLIKGINMVPQKLIDAGYAFQYPKLKEALESIV